MVSDFLARVNPDLAPVDTLNIAGQLQNSATWFLPTHKQEPCVRRLSKSCTFGYMFPLFGWTCCLHFRLEEWPSDLEMGAVVPPPPPCEFKWLDIPRDDRQSPSRIVPGLEQLRTTPCWRMDGWRYRSAVLNLDTGWSDVSFTTLRLIPEGKFSMFCDGGYQLLLPYVV
jgi:hypothetical protein